MCVSVCGDIELCVHVASKSILCHIVVTHLSGQNEEGDGDGHRPILTYTNVQSRVKSLVQKVAALKGAVMSNQALLASRIEEL